MKHVHVLFIFICAILFLLGCNKREYSKPGPSLIYLDFNREITNTGILPVKFQGDKYVSYEKGVTDTCLNLTKTALYRKPVIIDKGYSNSFSDYEGFTLLLWVKSDTGDPYEYVVAGQKLPLDNFQKYQGWHISKTQAGGWMWEASDGEKTISYKPSHKQQPLNDGKWHQIGFSLDKQLREARFYYDGNLKALFSTEEIENPFPGSSLFVGSDPVAKDIRIEAFNGMIDELGVWSRTLSDTQVAGHFRRISGKKLRPLPEYNDSITIMTWNIWNGGTSHGKYAGIQRIADIIKHNRADIISLQETLNAGEIIAGELDYYFYKRSDNLSVVSRFPLKKSFNVYRPLHFGCIQIDIGNDKEILVSPVWLSRQPNLPAYFIKENARADTIEVREMETRGMETRFLLSELRPLIQNNNEKASIIAGDFNSGSHLDWTERNKERHNDLVVEFPASKFMYEEGFSDVYRSIFPDETTSPGFTWSPIHKDGLQTRMDFIYFRGEMLVPTSARVIDTWPSGFPSDHAAVVASFKVK